MFHVTQCLLALRIECLAFAWLIRTKWNQLVCFLRHCERTFLYDSIFVLRRCRCLCSGDFSCWVCVGSPFGWMIVDGTFLKFWDFMTLAFWLDGRLSPMHQCRVSRPAPGACLFSSPSIYPHTTVKHFPVTQFGVTSLQSVIKQHTGPCWAADSLPSAVHWFYHKVLDNCTQSKIPFLEFRFYHWIVKLEIFLRSWII